MIIDLISDLHGHYPEIEGGDLLIVAGDLTARDLPFEFLKFLLWLDKQKYRRKIFIGGNHDNMIQEISCPSNTLPDNTEYLCDSGTQFEGLKMWGSPWTKTFEGMNPHCKAFTVDTEEELAEKWALIPDDVDILITHSPPAFILDDVLRKIIVDTNGNKIKKYEHCGSESLREFVFKVSPSLHIFGHIHERGGSLSGESIKFINASHVNERYEPVNPPLRVIL